MVSNSEFAWCIMGDFNAIRSASECRGRGTGERVKILMIFISLLISMPSLIFLCVVVNLLGTVVIEFL